MKQSFRCSRIVLFPDSLAQKEAVKLVNVQLHPWNMLMKVPVTSEPPESPNDEPSFEKNEVREARGLRYAEAAQVLGTAAVR